MHYYQFNIGDYASHTKGLSLLEDLAYRRLLDHYYLAEQPFNGCSTTVARHIGMREYVDEVDYVLRTFFTQDDAGNWRNTRADQEIQAFVRKSENASKAGKRSAAMRLNERSTDVEQTLNERQLTNNHKPITNKKNTSTELPHGFEKFWEAYDKRKGKQNAVREWRKHNPDAETVDKIISQARLYARNTELKYRKDPERWLKGKHWEDEVQVLNPLSAFADVYSQPYIPLSQR